MAKKTDHGEDSFEVRPSTIKGAGNGLFAKVKIRKGETIGYYIGKRITDRQLEHKAYKDNRYVFAICKDWNIVATEKDGNYTRMINHYPEGGKPNCEYCPSVRWKTIIMKALKTIKPGEELFADYGEEYWEAMKESGNHDVHRS